MKLKEIKKGILALPDKQIKPLVEWLRNYYDGPVWDRQMDADIERLGPDEWERRLRGEVEDSSTVSPVLEAAHKQRVREALDQMTEASRRRQAAIRLINRVQFPTKAARTRMLKDLECALGEPLDLPIITKSARARILKDLE